MKQIMFGSSSSHRNSSILSIKSRAKSNINKQVILLLFDKSINHILVDFTAAGIALSGGSKTSSIMQIILFYYWSFDML